MRQTFCTYVFSLALILAAVATVLYYYIASKVRSAGDNVSRLITPWGVKALAVRYARRAKELGWPHWPVSLMWFLIVLVMAFAIFDAIICHTR